MKRAWKGQTRGGAFGYLFFIYLIRVCGIRAAYAFLCFVVPYFVLFAPKATVSVWRYARRALHLNRRDSVRLLLKNYYRLGQILIDKVAIGNGGIGNYRFAFENYEPFLQLLDGDEGVIMIGAHVGNWEIGAPFFKDYGKKINIVMFDNEHRRIKHIMEQHATQVFPFKVIPVNKDSLTHVFSITEALREREYVCFQGDRYVSEEKVLTTTFLGRPAKFPLGPFLLASKLRVPVVFYFALREGGCRYRFHFFVADTVASPPGGVRREQALLQQYVAALERIVTRYPEQWFNYYDFWK